MPRPVYRWRFACGAFTRPGFSSCATFDTAQAAYTYAERVVKDGIDPERFVYRQVRDADGTWRASAPREKRIASFAGGWADR